MFYKVNPFLTALLVLPAQWDPESLLFLAVSICVSARVSTEKHVTNPFDFNTEVPSLYFNSAFHSEGLKDLNDKHLC